MLKSTYDSGHITALEPIQSLYHRSELKITASKMDNFIYHSELQTKQDPKTGNGYITKCRSHKLLKRQFQALQVIGTAH